jgi:hypothetical protein
MVQADVEKERQSPADLRDDGVGDSPLPARRLQVLYTSRELIDGQCRRLGDGVSGHGDGEHGRSQPGAAAGRAGHPVDR